MPTNDDRPLLTMQQVKDMRVKRDEIAGEVKTLLDEMAVLDRKLAAASLFMEAEEAAAPRPPVDEVAVEEKLPPMTETIERVVRGSPTPLNLRQVKAVLRHQGYPKARLGNYFYTAMRRLTEHGRIDRRGDTFTAPEAPAESSGGLEG